MQMNIFHRYFTIAIYASKIAEMQDKLRKRRKIQRLCYHFLISSSTMFFSSSSTAISEKLTRLFPHDNQSPYLPVPDPLLVPRSTPTLTSTSSGRFLFW